MEIVLILVVGAAFVGLLVALAESLVTVMSEKNDDDTQF